MSDKSGGLFSGLLIGTAIGAVVGVLAAPRTGKETRRVLKKSADALPELAEDLATSVQFQADRLSATTLTNWEGTLERLREAIAAGQTASRQEWSRQSPDDVPDLRYSTSEASPIPTEIARPASTQPTATYSPSAALDPES